MPAKKPTSSSRAKLEASKKTRRVISQHSQFKAIDDVTKIIEGVFGKKKKK